MRLLKLKDGRYVSLRNCEVTAKGKGNIFRFFSYAGEPEITWQNALDTIKELNWENCKIEFFVQGEGHQRVSIKQAESEVLAGDLDEGSSLVQIREFRDKYGYDVALEALGGGFGASHRLNECQFAETNEAIRKLMDEAKKTYKFIEWDYMVGYFIGFTCFGMDVIRTDQKLDSLLIGKGDLKDKSMKDKLAMLGYDPEEFWSYHERIIDLVTTEQEKHKQ